MIEFLSRLLETYGLAALCFVAIGGAIGFLCHARLRRLRQRERIARELEDSLVQNAQGFILNVHNIVQTLDADDPARRRMERTLDRADAQLSEDRDRVQNLRSQEDSDR